MVILFIQWNSVVRSLSLHGNGWSS